MEHLFNDSVSSLLTESIFQFDITRFLSRFTEIGLFNDIVNKLNICSGSKVVRYFLY